eukprot:SAG31_NODE_12896_length_908_cov_0.824475_2_plen_73_part_00
MSVRAGDQVLKVDFRKAQLQDELASVERWVAAQRNIVAAEVAAMQKSGTADSLEAYAMERMEMISQMEAKKR